MSVKLAVGVFMPETLNSLSLRLVLLPMMPSLIPQKNSHPGQLKALINIQGTGENHDV